MALAFIGFTDHTLLLKTFLLLFSFGFHETTLSLFPPTSLVIAVAFASSFSQTLNLSHSQAPSWDPFFLFLFCFVFLATPVAYGSFLCRGLNPGPGRSNTGSFNSLCWARDQTCASPVTQAAVVGSLIPCTRARSPLGPLLDLHPLPGMVSSASTLMRTPLHLWSNLFPRTQFP